MRAAELRADRGCSRGVRRKRCGGSSITTACSSAPSTLRYCGAPQHRAYSPVRSAPGLWRDDLDTAVMKHNRLETPTAAARRRFTCIRPSDAPVLSCTRWPIDPSNPECPCGRRLSTPTQSLGPSRRYRSEKMRRGLLASGAGAQPCCRHDTRHPAQHRWRHALATAPPAAWSWPCHTYSLSVGWQ